jgi:hypothetical protein
MHLQAEHNNDKLELVNAQNESLGQIAVERAENGLVTGAFAASPFFVAVEQIFRDYEEAVNLQSLSVVDELDRQIALLGLGVALPDGPRVDVEDVQIWSDGAISFRPVGQGVSILKARLLV